MRYLRGSWTNNQPFIPTRSLQLCRQDHGYPGMQCVCVCARACECQGDQDWCVGMSRREMEGPEVQRVSCTFCDELTARDHPESTQCHSFPSLPGLGPTWDPLVDAGSLSPSWALLASFLPSSVFCCLSHPFSLCPHLPTILPPSPLPPST